MQAQESSATSTNPRENPTSELIADDADWLEHITLDSSDCIQPSANFYLKTLLHSDPSDDDVALAAHLWDRQHASDLDEWQWNSDDLVSSASSVDESISDVSPRLARKDEFEQGIRRDWTRTREYREQWEEDHIFYKQKIQARLEDEYDGEDEQSDGSEGIWSGQADQPDWGTPATSGGVDSSTVSTEPWTAEDGWEEEGKGDDEGFWTTSGSSQRQNLDKVDKERCVRTDEESGKLCLWKHLSGQGPTSRGKKTHNNANSVSTLRSFSTSTRTSSTATCSSIYNKPNTTNLNSDDTNPSPPPHSSQNATTPLRNPTRTTRFLDPEPVALEPALSSRLNDGQILNSFLDTCIAKTQALLVNANEALNSVANIDEICESDYDLLTEGRQQYSRSRDTIIDMKTPGLEIHTPQVSVLKKSGLTTFTPKEIVRVERWWKVKGGESWREIGGWGEENLYVR